MIMNRQIKKDEAVDSLYGQFNTFDSLKVSEKTYIHHHVGHDTGGIFPHYILPFITIARNWFNHPNNARWRRTIHDFAYGYLLPACKANPFMIIPVGYFENQGLLNFCGPWHGFNATLAFGAKLAMEIGGLLGDDEFTSIAVANIQWICGLNSGIKKSMLDSCVFWDEDIPDDKYESYSQILGMGKRAVGGWTKMKGTIPNGFCVNPQFEFKIEPTLKNDAPIRYTDEDWIPHSGGYISAVSAMSSSHLFRKLLCDD